MTTSPWAVVRTRTKAIQHAASYFQAGDVGAFHETMSVLSFRNTPVSVTLANPSLPDCPLIGVSQGFEVMTGFSRSEIIGRNCRFLNRGCHVPASLRHELRTATRCQKQFVAVLANRRRNGEIFKNLLHLTSLRVGANTYMLGIQADVTYTDVDFNVAHHKQELDAVVDAIFASNVDAWAAIHAARFGVAKLGTLISYTASHLLPRYEDNVYSQARSAFVSLNTDEHQGVQFCYSNTFLEVCSEESPSILLGQLRRVYSEPALGIKSSELGDSIRVPLAVLRHSMWYWQDEPFAYGEPVETIEKQVTACNDEADQEHPLISEGSRYHPDGCTPCSFHCYSKMGCNKGQECMYCHMEHPKRRTRRRGKKQPKGALPVYLSTADDTTKDEQCGEFTHSVLPSATPSDLMPLLGALEILAPLPIPTPSSSSRRTAEGRPVVFSGNTSSAEDTDSEVMVPSRSLSEISIKYSESFIVLGRLQWKQVLPFVHAPRGPCVFRIQPPLPAGLTVDTGTGVISGAARWVTDVEGSSHEVTMETAAGNVTTSINILVVNTDFDSTQLDTEFGTYGYDQAQFDATDEDNEW